MIDESNPTLIAPEDASYPLIDSLFFSGATIPVPWGDRWLWIKATKVGQRRGYKLWLTRRPAKSAKSRRESV